MISEHSGWLHQRLSAGAEVISKAGSFQYIVCRDGCVKGACYWHTGGRISGEVRINGYPQEQRTWARVSGYVEQSDIHSPQATVEEALWFSARLRLTRDTSNKVMWAFIYEVRPPIMQQPPKLDLACFLQQSAQETYRCVSEQILIRSRLQLP